MNAIFVFYATLLVPAFVYSADQPRLDEEAYHLHQAINYLSVYSTGRCPQAFNIAKNHMKEIKQKKGDKPFGDIVVSLKKIKEPSLSDVTALEALRLKYVETLEANSIEHKMTRHREIETTCPKAPHIQ